MYLNVQYTDHQGGSKSDSVRSFTHYEVTGDSDIAGLRYSILVEEDLALFNTDIGLVKYRSAYAVASDSSSVRILSLKGGEPASGRFPFKIAALDTLHFNGEVTALKMPLSPGKSWYYSKPEGVGSSGTVSKTFLGRDTITLGGNAVPALEFRVDVASLDYIRMLEWYADSVKVLSRFSSSTTFGGKDSSRSEQVYLGKRTFTKDDTLTVLRGTIFDPSGQ